MEPFGRYNLLEFIASGGMADVYRAEAPGEAGFVKEVAIKVIRGNFRDQPEFLEMFKQEARLSSKLTHANIVQVFDFGQVDGRYYIAMEFVHGRSLDRVAALCRSLPGELDLTRIVYICSQVAAALAFAHREKENGQPSIVHRDISPHNVLITYEGEVKLTDFGIARAMNVAGLTRPGTVKGKPTYMAPEQARGHEVDGRADIFALGVVLWELLCGFNLFRRDSEASSLMAIIGPEPEIEPPSKYNSAVPPDLDRAVLGALERDPEKRTASVQDLANQLQAVLFRIVKAPGDVDLRGLMHKLSPQNAGKPDPTPQLSTPKKVTLQLPVSDPVPAEPKTERLQWEDEGLQPAGDTIRLLEDAPQYVTERSATQHLGHASHEVTVRNPPSNAVAPGHGLSRIGRIVAVSSSVAAIAVAALVVGSRAGLFARTSGVQQPALVEVKEEKTLVMPAPQPEAPQGSASNPPPAQEPKRLLVEEPAVRPNVDLAPHASPPKAP